METNSMKDKTIYLYNTGLYAVQHPESSTHIVIFKFNKQSIVAHGETFEVEMGNPVFVRYGTKDTGTLMPCGCLSLHDSKWNDSENILGAMVDPERQLEIPAKDIKF